MIRLIKVHMRFSTFQPQPSGMSFESKIGTQKGETLSKRVVKMTEKKEAPTSKAFTSDDNGMMFVARRQPPPEKDTGGSMFKAEVDSPVGKKQTSPSKNVKKTRSIFGSIYRA